VVTLAGPQTHQGLVRRDVLEVLRRPRGLLRLRRPRPGRHRRGLHHLHKGAHARAATPQDDVQVSHGISSRAMRVGRNGGSTRMNVRQFNELVEPSFTLPSIFLFVVIVQTNATQYTMSEAASLCYSTAHTGRP